MKFSVKKNKLGFFETSPKPTKKYLDNFYKHYFLKNQSKSFSIKYSKDEISYIKKRAKFVTSFILKNVKKKKINALDLGCGEGFQLSSYSKNKRFNAIGVDYDDFAIKSKNKKVLSLFIKKNPDQFINEQISKKKKYDLISLGNILEHVRDVIGYIKKVKKIMNKNSYLFVVIPNDFSKIQKLAKKKKLAKTRNWFAPIHHISYFNQENIEKFFNYFKFNIKDIISDFPIEFFLFAKSSNYYLNKKKGKEAYKARVDLDNFILSQNFNGAYTFFKGCYNTGLGRNSLIILKKND